jgi:hypothetical protein
MYFELLLPGAERALCGIAPGCPIVGCDPPHPASIAAATELDSA